MKLNKLRNKGDEYHIKNITKRQQFNTKNGKGTLLKITSPDMMDIYEVRDEFSDKTSPVFMEDCVNKNMV